MIVAVMAKACAYVCRKCPIGIDSVGEFVGVEVSVWIML